MTFAIFYWFGVAVLAACISLVVIGVGRLIAMWQDRSRG